MSDRKEGDACDCGGTFISRVEVTFGRTSLDDSSAIVLSCDRCGRLANDEAEIARAGAENDPRPLTNALLRYLGNGLIAAGQTLKRMK